MKKTSKKIVVATLVVGILSTGFVIPLMTQPASASEILPVGQTPTADQVREAFSPRITKAMYEYAKLNVTNAKLDTTKLKQGVVELKLPQLTGKYIWVATMEDDNDNIDLHIGKGGKTVTAKLKKGQETWIKVDIEEEVQGFAYGIRYIWDDKAKKLTAKTSDETQLEVYKEVQEDQKKFNEEIKMDEEKKQQQLQVDRFSDIANHWAKDSIIRAANLKMVNGFPDGTFCPDNSISRAEFVAILINTLGYEKSKNKPVFTDVSGWAESSIATALDKGILKENDVANKKYGPNDAITRKEMALLTIRALGLEDKAWAITDVKAPFKDTNNLNKEWARFIQLANEEKLMFGDTNGNFRADGYTTRAEGVVVLLRVADRLKK
ncbi:S-layer homology domain-containing protein [Aneurinibacillus tyrosinisolvens]|uniref:S-layer homology domain-containing protein n=1 Tax=Aneurinibacillus tyrosinisolvens TaxID=1443435 RepID=UPI00063F2A20|nr:S-layer homology domain-containing protein [Aneurinibacillus tyrosinisolvens]